MLPSLVLLGHRGHVLLTPRHSELHDDWPQCHVKRASARSHQKGHRPGAKAQNLTETAHTHARSLCTKLRSPPQSHMRAGLNMAKLQPLTADQHHLFKCIEALQPPCFEAASTARRLACTADKIGLP